MGEKKIATRDGFGEAIVELGKDNPDIYVVDIDIGKSGLLKGFGIVAFGHGMGGEMIRISPGFLHRVPGPIQERLFLSGWRKPAFPAYGGTHAQHNGGSTVFQHPVLLP